ncbi:MAG: hypothetical protein WC378_18935, partial [Opitutaceae bacterium]
MKLNTKNPGLELLLILAVVILAIVAASYGYYLRQKTELEKNTGDQLNAIADLKASQIIRWRQERLNDALLIQNDWSVIETARNFLEHPSDGEFQEKLASLTNAWKRFSTF